MKLTRLRHNTILLPRTHQPGFGTIGTPVNFLYVTVEYAVQNRGTAPGKVGVKLDFVREESGGDATWFRYTPSKNDPEDPTPEPGLSKPGMITDKMYRDTGYKVTGSGNAVTIGPGETIDLGGNTPTAQMYIPGGSVPGDSSYNPTIVSWVKEFFWSDSFKIVAWLVWLFPDDTIVKRVDNGKHEFPSAWTFGGYYVGAPDIIQVGQPSLSVISG